MTGDAAILQRASLEPSAEDDAVRLPALSTEELCEAARERRDRVWGRTLTYSPKVFLPVTNLCRNRCDYCSFRRSPGDADEWTMSPDEIREWLQRAHAQGCVEALFCLGDTPETGFREYRALMDAKQREVEDARIKLRGKLAAAGAHTVSNELRMFRAARKISGKL